MGLYSSIRKCEVLGKLRSQLCDGKVSLTTFKTLLEYINASLIIELFRLSIHNVGSKPLGVPEEQYWAMN